MNEETVKMVEKDLYLRTARGSKLPDMSRLENIEKINFTSFLLLLLVQKELASLALF